jgi:hypothetical protein
MAGVSELHPLVADAANGVLPEWAVAYKKRRAHIVRVAELLGEWGKIRCDDPVDVQRWIAAGYLHDALRDAKPAELREGMSYSLDQMPDEVIHGPAVADRLRRAGVTDEPLLTAIAFHSVGSRTSTFWEKRSTWRTFSSLDARSNPNGGASFAPKCLGASIRSLRRWSGNKSSS